MSGQSLNATVDLLNLVMIVHSLSIRVLWDVWKCSSVNKGPFDFHVVHTDILLPIRILIERQLLISSNLWLGIVYLNPILTPEVSLSCGNFLFAKQIVNFGGLILCKNKSSNLISQSLIYAKSLCYFIWVSGLYQIRKAYLLDGVSHILNKRLLLSTWKPSLLVGILGVFIEKIN